MNNETQTISENQILTGPLFQEPVRVITATQNGKLGWVVGLVGLQTQKYRQVTLTPSDLGKLKVSNTNPSFDGDGQLLRLGLQAYSLGIAYEFDPYFGLSISRVDPLPHQLEAVYDHLLKLARVRFLLADDAGAGKTIMAGLLIRELELRGLAERILVVCPSNLAFQWQRELKEKFDEQFHITKGSEIRDQFGANQWLERKRVITSLDLAKRQDILPGLKQVRWDLVIVDEAHRMSAADESHKSLRYKLGELLRDSSDHILLLTGTPHKGDPENFSLFLQLLDKDAYADVKSIREAMDRRQAPFYLRRTKEAMVYFPRRQEDGTWMAEKIFTKRLPHTVAFHIDGPEFELYKRVTHFVKQQSNQAAAQGDDSRARAVGFLMALYQRRLASSTYAMQHSLENRVRRLEETLAHAQELLQHPIPNLPDQDELEEMDDADREQLEAQLAAISLARNPEQVLDEIRELKSLAEEAQAVEASGTEAKLSKLKSLLQEHGFFDDPSKRLLIFTEFKDTLDYLVSCLKAWGFSVGTIHGGMKAGARDESGTRLFAEQQFREGATQILVATEAAGEGINLQVCNVLFNYDIPWNPNRLEQRMGRIHRYGQTKDCLIFNFVATNTVEGRVLQKLLQKLQEIRDALDDDAVFNVVGEVLPGSRVEQVLRDYYAGRLGDADLEERMLRNVDEGHFRNICQNALEGLASKKLNLSMLVERRARAQERRVVPETIARFLQEAAKYVPWALRPLPNQPNTFEPARTPEILRQYEREADWRIAPLANRYPRCSTDRGLAEKQNLEWVTPGHPMFEAVRRHIVANSRDVLANGTTYYSLEHVSPARIDFYRACVVDGSGVIIHEKLFAVETQVNGEPRLCEPSVLGDFEPAKAPAELPPASSLPEPDEWLHRHVLASFLDATRQDRIAEVQRIAKHVELSLTELLQRADEEVGRTSIAKDRGEQGAEGRLAQAMTRCDDLQRRRTTRRNELERQSALTLQNVNRIASVLVLPHPERNAPEVRRLHQNPETEAIAMLAVMQHERAQNRQVEDVSAKNLGYDITSLDLQSGDLRLIEVKGIGAKTGTVLLTPNERRVAEDRRDCYWLYVVTDCASTPTLQEPIRDPAQYSWHEVSKVQHYYLDVDAMTKPMQVREESPGYNQRDTSRK